MVEIEIDDLNTPFLQKFIGGDAMIQSDERRLCIRGEIAQIIRPNLWQIQISFAWTVKRTISSNARHEWEFVGRSAFQTVDTPNGVSQEMEDGRIVIRIPSHMLMLVLYPSGCSAINPQKIYGMPPDIAIRQAQKLTDANPEPSL